jgi:hypothetical protein
MKRPASTGWLLPVCVALALAGLATVPADAGAIRYCHTGTPGQMQTVGNIRVLRSSCATALSLIDRWKPLSLPKSKVQLSGFTCYTRTYPESTSGNVTCKGSLRRWVWFSFWG